MGDGVPISGLAEDTSPAANDQLPFLSQRNGTRRMSLTTLGTFLATLIPITDDKLTQYAAPSATGFTVTIAPLAAGGSVWLILTPTGTLAAGTIVLPASGSAADRQEVLVNTTQAVTTLTVSSSGLNVTGAPTTLAANAAFRMRFDAVTSTWYKVSS